MGGSNARPVPDWDPEVVKAGPGGGGRVAASVLEQERFEIRERKMFYGADIYRHREIEQTKFLEKHP